jgi:hypothetical protein
VLGTAAKKAHETPAAFARRVLGVLEARGAQLRFATQWLSTIFGNPDLSACGDLRSKQLYAVVRHRQWKPPVAFDTLVAAFPHEASAPGEKPRTKEPPPEVVAAEKIERALLAALRS